MERPILDMNQVEQKAAQFMANFQTDGVKEVQEAMKTHPVVVVGMAGNPFCKRVKKSLEKAGVTVHYIEYGSYFSGWKKRLAIKMWSGWPTYPLVFVKGKLLGGCEDTEAAIQDGRLKKLLA